MITVGTAPIDGKCKIQLRIFSHHAWCPKNFFIFILRTGFTPRFRDSEINRQKRDKWGQMYGLGQQPRSQDSAVVTSADTVDSCSNSRVKRLNRACNGKKRKTITEIVFRFALGSPEGDRTLDLRRERAMSWTTRRPGRIIGLCLDTAYYIKPENLMSICPAKPAKQI